MACRCDDNERIKTVLNFRVVDLAVSADSITANFEKKLGVLELIFQRRKMKCPPAAI